MIKGTLFGIGLVLCLCAGVHATVLLSDSFDSYTTGELVPQGGWEANAGLLTSPVLVVEGIAAGDKEISLTQTSGSRQDVTRPLGQAMAAGDKWYAGYTVTVGGAVSAADYFACFHQLVGSTNYFPTKVGVATSEGSDFTFYIHQGSGSTSTDANFTQYWPTGLSFGTSYRLVVSYDYSEGVGELWIDPVLAQGPDGNAKIQVTNKGGSALIEADRYVFRQGSNAAGTQLVDDVLVGTTWGEVVPEPATFTLLVIGALPLIRRRR